MPIDKGDPDRAVREIRYRTLRVLPPIGKQRRYPALTLTVRAEAIEKLRCYALRWKIEVFHKILKSGCKAEESKLRTAQPLANLIAVFSTLSWRASSA